MYKDGAAWADLTVDYKDSLNMIKEVKSRRKNSDNHADAVDCEIAGSMESDLTQTVRELKKKTFYEYNAITEEDILNPLYGLTERQREIALLRQKHSCSEVAKLLKLEQCTVFITYEKVVNKLINFKTREKNGENILLTDREEEVYELYINGLKPKAISKELGIGVNSVKYYLKMIKEKTGGKIIKVGMTG